MNNIFNLSNINQNKSFDIEICAFLGNFEIQFFFTSLHVNSNFHICYKIVKYEKEINKIDLRSDSMIIYYNDNSVQIGNFLLKYENGQIMDFEFCLKKEFKENNVQIFENIYLFTKNNFLNLNSITINKNSCDLVEEGIFNINNILTQNMILNEESISNENSDNNLNFSNLIFKGFFIEGNLFKISNN